MRRIPIHKEHLLLRYRGDRGSSIRYLKIHNHRLTPSTGTQPKDFQSQQSGPILGSIIEKHEINGGSSSEAEIADVLNNLKEQNVNNNKNNNDKEHLSNSKRRPTISFLLDAEPTKQESIKLSDTEPDNKPPLLAHGLERSLYEPVTLHPLKDQRSGVYNFAREVENIAPEMLEKKSLEEDALFITPHRDKALLTLANKFNQKYISSTSSMTSVLSHLHFLLSNFRQLNIVESSISKNFPQINCNFTKGAQFPATIILRKMDKKVRSIDPDRSLDKEIILSILGHTLEDFLTKRPPVKVESYHYSKIDDFILRSQLDAYDPKLPGTGVFDLKTRAVTAIRHDQ